MDAIFVDKSDNHCRTRTRDGPLYKLHVRVRQNNFPPLMSMTVEIFVNINRFHDHVMSIMEILLMNCMN